MKKVLLGLVLSFSAFAGSQSVIYPQVYNYGYNVQVSVWNHTDRAVNCSGSLNLRLADNTTQTEHVFTVVHPRQTYSRNYYPRMSGERFTSAFHSINCF